MRQWSPRVWQAADRGEHAAVLRLARTERGWTQDELGQRFGASGSTISRLETGRRPLRDVATLRRLAAILGLPSKAFGLTDHTDTATRTSPMALPVGHKVEQVMIPWAQEGDDQVRRRAFLQLAAVTGVAGPDTGNAVAADDVDPAVALANRLGGVLLGPIAAADPAPLAVLRQTLTAAQREFAACRYLPLAHRLPVLLAAAEATSDGRPDPTVARVLAASYNLATRALIKLKASGLEWISADRALRAARAGGDPLALVESQRMVASCARRAGYHDRAETLTLAAAEYLDIDGQDSVPEHLAAYSSLYCSAAYAAARAGDRDRANDLLTEAETAAARLTEGSDQRQAVTANLVSHRVSTAYLLGDAGTALAHAHSLPLAAVPTTERRARLLVDSAQAFAQWDKPQQAYQTLLAAEHTAPGEVRTRNAVRRLVADLMTSSRQAAMPGLPALANRVHAVA